MGDRQHTLTLQLLSWAKRAGSENSKYSLVSKKAGRERKERTRVTARAEAKTHLASPLMIFFYCYVSITIHHYHSFTEFVECHEMASVLYYLKDNLIGLP